MIVDMGFTSKLFSLSICSCLCQTPWVVIKDTCLFSCWSPSSCPSPEFRSTLSYFPSLHQPPPWSMLWTNGWLLKFQLLVGFHQSNLDNGVGLVWTPRCFCCLVWSSALFLKEMLIPRFGFFFWCHHSWDFLIYLWRGHIIQYMKRWWKKMIYDLPYIDSILQTKFVFSYFIWLHCPIYS